MQAEHAEITAKADADVIKAEGATIGTGSTKQEDTEMKDASESDKDKLQEEPIKAEEGKQQQAKAEEGKQQQAKAEGRTEDKEEEVGKKGPQEKLPEKPIIQLHGKLSQSGDLLSAP